MMKPRAILHSRHDGAGYAKTLATLRELPGCIGLHLCGAYLRNETRKRALRDAMEKVDEEAIQYITIANLATAQWMESAAKP
jgi:hypothetical protein